MRSNGLVLVACAFSVFLSSAVFGQAKNDALASLVDEYFAAEKDKDAKHCLEKILALKPATDRLLSLVTRRPSELPEFLEFSIEHQGSALLVRIQVPKGHDFKAKPLPVIFDPASNGKGWHLVPEGRLIRVAIPKFEPAPFEFTDLGRDGYLRVLRMAAFLANGNMEQLWFTGFSWAAHAAWDTAFHRPDVLRGIVPMGGGPRRVHFRLMSNLAGMRILSLCGAKDDPQLVWNLKEVDRIKRKHKLDYQLVLDPDLGHRTALKGRDRFLPTILESTPRLPWPKKGRLLFDMARVENRWLRIVDVDAKALQAPRRIPVSRSLSYDQKRRVTIKAMDKYVGKIDWNYRPNGRGGVHINLKGRSVRKAIVMIRASMVAPGSDFSLKAGKTKVARHALKIDPEVLLTEARRLGDRIDPIIAAYAVSF